MNEVGALLEQLTELKRIERNALADFAKAQGRLKSVQRAIIELQHIIDTGNATSDQDLPVWTVDDAKYERHVLSRLP